MTCSIRNSLSSVVVLTFALASAALADRIRMPRPAPGGAAGATTVNIPHVVNDNAGNQWMIYQGGWMRQNGNMPLYSQASMLMINGNAVQTHTNQAARDPKTGEIIFENMSAPGGVIVTRRILINNEGGYVRYIDILRNAQQQPASVNVAW